MSIQVAVHRRSPRPVGLHRRLGALLVVFTARVLVRCLPLSGLRGLLTRVQRSARRPATVAEAADAHDLVTSVSVRCAGLACLERSVAVVLLCASHRTWVRWCVGVRTPPFESHAWVEAADQPVREPTDAKRIYTTILSV